MKKIEVIIVIQLKNVISSRGLLHEDTFGSIGSQFSTNLNKYGPIKKRVVFKSKYFFAT